MGGRGGGGVARDAGPSPSDGANDSAGVPDASIDTASPPPPGAWRHPGILLNRAQLDLVRDKIKQGAQPWKAAYDTMAASGWAALTWAPKPRDVVECGAGSNPNLGCSDERADAEAAYTHALLWHFTGDEAHARKAVEILDAWAKVLKDHTNSNARLQTGWAGAVFPLAAEILRATYPGWGAAQVDQFKRMLATAYLPVLIKGAASTNGNWELVMIEAVLAIAVFNEDRASFDQGLAMWRKRVPAYMYLKTDGLTLPPPGGSKSTPAALIAYWQGQTTFVDGLAQETCRDFGHTQWGIAAALAGAETALQQGVDLYAGESARLTAALEFHADYVLGKAVPPWLCGGTLSLGAVPSFEIGYNHLHNRLGLALPLTERYLAEKTRKSASPVSYFIVWETLTHADVGWAGLR